jgi:argonaute-like protein implicated in RNA metabolism and viral defense
MTQQAEDNYYKQEENNKVFSEQLEAQRHEIVETVEDINDIGGASISSEMKEYLLHDIMELNDNRDPILMEKLFGVLRLCLNQLVLNYGEAYMTETNSYWKNKYQSS